MMLPLPSWSDSLRIGDIIDQQHMQLIDLCNRVADFTSASTPSAVEKYHRLLNELADLTEAHLLEEERRLLKNNCPTFVFEAHKSEHDKFRGMLAAMVDAGHVGDLQPSNLYQFTKDYLIKHMISTDIACAEYLK